MALFPGLFEAGVTDDMSASQGFIAMLTTRYGLYALALLEGAFIPMTGGSYIKLIVRNGRIATGLLITLACISITLEIWGFVIKGTVTIFAIPGAVAGIMCFYLLKFKDRYIG
jgi:hypothetical protein